ncbi:MAG: Uma2 family endonuclease, partial [Microcystaceae cyanobacterium]
RSGKKSFQLHLVEKINLFGQTPDLKPSPFLILMATLKDNLAIALAINTEKVRSELLITPILLEIRRRFNMKTLMKWSLEDYHQLINNGVLCKKKVELLDGELIEMSPESPLHSYVTRSSSDYLRQALKRLARVIEAHPITLTNSEPEPDLAIVKLSPTDYKHHHPFPEDIFWLIEISNKTLNYDLNDKRKIYAQDGIIEYWVADINNRQVHIFLNPKDGDYQTTKIVSEGVIKTQTFPTIDLSIQHLFSW